MALRTLGEFIAGSIRFLNGAYGPQVLSATIARTDTTAKKLFTLPANAVLDRVDIYGPTGSNAGSSATLSAGSNSSSSPTNWLNGADVKDSAGVGSQTPSFVLGPVGSSAVDVYGKYHETGTASSGGGPWRVTVQYH